MKNSIAYYIICSCLLLISCQNKDEIKLEQYKISGKEIYETNCANCHQKDGKGLGTLYPPIANADFLKDKKNVICIIKNGISGEIVVNNKKYNQPMPANKKLLDLDIAELTTYIYTTWGNEKFITETDSVHKILERCK